MSSEERILELEAKVAELTAFVQQIQMASMAPTAEPPVDLASADVPSDDMAAVETALVEIGPEPHRGGHAQARRRGCCGCRCCRRIERHAGRRNDGEPLLLGLHENTTAGEPRDHRPGLQQQPGPASTQLPAGQLAGQHLRRPRRAGRFHPVQRQRVGLPGRQRGLLVPHRRQRHVRLHRDERSRRRRLRRRCGLGRRAGPWSSRQPRAVGRRVRLRPPAPTPIASVRSCATRTATCGSAWSPAPRHVPQDQPAPPPLAPFHALVAGSRVRLASRRAPAGHHRWVTEPHGLGGRQARPCDRCGHHGQLRAGRRHGGRRQRHGRQPDAVPAS